MRYRSPGKKKLVEKSEESRIHTGTGFRRSTMKLSALCIMNLVNLLHRIRSISSACLILMLSRIELTEGSIRTRSFSFRDIVRGLRRTSFELLKCRKMNDQIMVALGKRWKFVRWFDLRLVMAFYYLIIHGQWARDQLTRIPYLRREVFERQRSCEGGSHGGEVWS